MTADEQLAYRSGVEMYVCGCGFHENPYNKKWIREAELHAERENLASIWEDGWEDARDGKGN